jgi:hypothetical protein
LGSHWLLLAAAPEAFQILQCDYSTGAPRATFKGLQWLWRIVTKSGGKKAPAIIAVAHTLLLLIYQVLQTNKPFEDRTAAPLDERQKQRLIRHHIRRLGKLGIAIQAVAPSTPGTGKPRRIGQSRPPRTHRPRCAPSNSKL